ncbi:MAG TPA: hypothetical protein VFJ49_06770, partial [Methyloceanibacter sp.]|nr:hypothetical protein [Methyloceanibacter sp.]
LCQSDCKEQERRSPMTNRIPLCSTAIAGPDDGHLLNNAVQIALSGVTWFLAAAWLDFSGALKMHLAPAAMIGVLLWV